MTPVQGADLQPEHGNGAARDAGAERDAYLGETLYHFVGSGSDDDLMYIFDSIVRRGLLMTVGDKKGTLDRLSFEVQGNTFTTFEIMQKARVCFTDIPSDKLYNHVGEYGKFGIGFSRQTIISWGGNPVFYVPNHIDGPVTSVMGGLIYGLFQAAGWVDVLEHFCSGGLQPLMRPDIFGTNDIPLTVDGQDFRGERRREFLYRGRDAIEQLLSFVKQMSHSDINDYSYLYEREWRIVTGISVNGQSLARELTAGEKTELCGRQPRWRQPLELRGRPLYHRDHAAMIDLFRMFNGLGESTVSKGITDILVPNDNMMERIQNYIAEHPQMFAAVKPSVNVLP
jgi:Putative abortive phage resistance protein AbiGi, antitoxin